MSIAHPEDHRASTYTHTFQSGQTVTFPRFASVMTFGRARRMRKLDEAEQMFALVEEVCDEKALAVLDTMEPDEAAAFFEAWQEHSGVSAGES